MIAPQAMVEPIVYRPQGGSKATIPKNYRVRLNYLRLPRPQVPKLALDQLEAPAVGDGNRM